MEHPEQYYLIPASLDNGALFMGLPREESLPTLIIGALGFMVHHELIGTMVAAGCFFTVRYIKGRFGINVFSRCLYYYFTSDQNRYPFKRLPPSHLRYWRG
ncbi:type IV conjugative transfer system protein TraL [Vibrio mediterranei]|uniref:Type IV conjugative transfer system protein TraL n=1 Tax=Vibrio mediterranei TaxID=689 RepID=A0AAN1KRD0_9VIBR|nr:type IV conjugative transfer system protein TraL [Vibrio mediterranei]ASI93386.1 type IV conjugative transfer system protein TraL [Vibrio mediterranei]ASI93433.1 type IV conjugative transfer system protein TraL [Vibrio mediterranei]